MPKEKLLCITTHKLYLERLIEASPEIEQKFEITVIDLYMRKITSLKYPQNLPISQVPFILPLQLSIDKYENHNFFKDRFHCKYAFKHPYKHVEAEQSIEKQLDEIKVSLDGFSKILTITSDDYSSVNSTMEIMLYLYDNILPENIQEVRVNKIHSHLLKNEYDKNNEHKGVNDPLYCYGKTKKYFDWLWAINSAPVFGKILHSVGASTKNILSKYELQVFLFVINNNILFTDLDGEELKNEAVNSIRNDYKGTGKYTFETTGLGAKYSHSSIFINLKNRGLLDEFYKPTAMGLNLHKLIHARSYDPDLPFRLKLWCDNQDINGIERYISKFFKRQKKFNSVKIK